MPAKTFQPEIVMRDPNALTPYHRNTRKHPQSQIEKLAGSIAEFDFDQPIVVDGKGVIIKGHGRREAAIRLGLKQVPVIVRNDLTPAQVKAARIADNRLPAEAEDDYEAIAAELEELASLDFDLTLTGFDDAELDKLLSDTQTEFQGSQMFDGSDEDEEPEPAQPPVGERYPLAIVLSSGELQEWKQRKEALGEKQDRAAFLKLMRVSDV